MSKKEEFKNFILKKPELIDYVENNNSSWQKLFEIYDLYGEDKQIWNKLIENKIVNNSIDIKNIINVIKNIDLDSLENNIQKVQKVVGLMSEFAKPEENLKKEIKSNEEKIDQIYGEDNEK